MRHPACSETPIEAVERYGQNAKAMEGAEGTKYIENRAAKVDVCNMLNAETNAPDSISGI